MSAQKFTIIIDEAQREILTHAVLNCERFPTRFDLSLLADTCDALNDLPGAEMEDPGAIHDFTA